LQIFANGRRTPARLLAYVQAVPPSQPGTFSVLLALFLGLHAAPTSGRSAHVTATLLPETEWIEPGRPFMVGLHLKMDAGWHTYWKNPGDSGLPTRIRWTLPDGFRAEPLQWPAPSRMVAGPLASYGYGEEVLLLSQLAAPANLPPGTVRIAARADWLECQEACLPGKAEMELSLPVRSGTAPTVAQTGAAFAEARRRLPREATGWKIEADAEHPALVIRPPRGTALGDGILFFSELPRVIEYAAEQRLVRRGDAYRLELVKDANASRPLPGLVGVLVLDGRAGKTAPHAVRVELRPKTGS
jgi:DsbC/DsbD-like thiol-disulfide interchange protein